MTSNWTVGIATALIGVIVTLGVAWFQLGHLQNEAALAEQERARSVRDTLIVMAEEHVLNGKPIEPARFARLIEERRRQERVSLPISTLSIMERAEFNIINSRYLTFERKEELKPIFDDIYQELAAIDLSSLPQDGPQSELFQEIARNIQQGRSSDALAALSSLSDSYSESMKLAQQGRDKPTLVDATRELFGNPWFLIFSVAYFLFIFLAFYIRRNFLIRGKRLFSR